MAGYCRPELLCRQSVPEHLHAVNGDNRNVVLVSSEQVRVAFNVNLGERIVVGTTGGCDDPFSLVAKVTTGTAIDYDVQFSSHVQTG